MKYRSLGGTGLEVPELIFGCGNVGGIMIRTDDDTMRTVIQKALDAGIDWFDTAAQYGDGKSEENLGRILKELGATPRISTKFRLDTDDLSDIAGQVEQRVTDSLRRLGADSVDLIQLHNFIGGAEGNRAISLEQVIGTNGAISAMEGLRDQGMVRHIGITAFGDLDDCKSVVASGRVETAQVYFNLINPTAGRPIPMLPSGQDFSGLIETCVRNDVGIIAIRTMAAGILASAEPLERVSIITPNTDKAVEERMANAVFARIGNDYGSRAQTAIRFVLSHPNISCIDFAPGQIEHLDEALAAAEMGSLPYEALSAIGEVYEAGFE